MIRYLKQNLKFKRVGNENSLSTCNALEKIEEEIPSSSKSNVPENRKNHDISWVDRALVRTVSECKNRENLVQSITCGDSSKINPNIFLNDQIPTLPFIPNREMSRNQFSVGERIGKGNFGTVYKGEANGLFYPDSKTDVAIKTIHDTSDPHEIKNFTAEIKILSNIDLHCNLVNMLGSHTTKIKETGEMWLLLEFCEWGDLKNVLLSNRKVFESSFSKNSSKKSAFDNRLLITWAFHIAKGMEYLASKRIMHGDLAARNILICGGDTQCEKLVAKVSDFGLSKKIASANWYLKKVRNFVPWKWMAYEFLENNAFQMKSDVWSYGVVIWELFSLAEEPYGDLTYSEVFDDLKNGRYLSCPEMIQNIKKWPAKATYDQIASKCFVREEKDRASFTDLVAFITPILNDQEIKTYKEVSKLYSTKWSLLLDEPTRRRLHSSTKGDRRTIAESITSISDLC